MAGCGPGSCAGALTHAGAAGILRNPVYAGAYVFGRRRVVNPDGSVRSAVTLLPRDQRKVLIRDHHPGYITWQDYLANEAELAGNRTNAGARPPREGTALCQGIVFCGACGRPMQVRYQDRPPRYECGHSRADHVATPLCGSVRADTIDAVASAALLAAVTPDQVALTVAVAGEVTVRRQRSVRAAERARYDADRAERAFLACEPENRLVARTLEARWETTLTGLADAEAALAGQRCAQPELPGPDQLAATVADLPALWSAPATSDKDRKRLLRALLADVTITPVAGDSSQICVGLRWKSGGQPADPGHPAQERLPAALYRSRGDRPRPPHRPQPGQQRPGPSAQPGRARHRHRAALRRRRRRQPAQLPPHPLPRAARGRRADPAPGRRAHRRVRRHRALLDQRRLPARPPRPGRPLVPSPSRPRRKPRAGTAPPARPTSTAPPTSLPANTSSASPMPPAGSASNPTSSTTGHNGATSPPGEATPDGYRSTSPPPPNARASSESPAHTSSPKQSKPEPDNAWKGKQYEAHVPTVADRVVQAALKLVLEPIFETGFLPLSYGFRPGYRPSDPESRVMLPVCPGPRCSSSAAPCVPSMRLQVAYARGSGIMSAMREASRLSAVRRCRFVSGPQTGR
jgi:Recombinase zinc beta ribbon domain/Recombinase